MQQVDSVKTPKIAPEPFYLHAGSFAAKPLLLWPIGLQMEVGLSKHLALNVGGAVELGTLVGVVIASSLAFKSSYVTVPLA